MLMTGIAAPMVGWNPAYMYTLVTVGSKGIAKSQS